jgi:hypothetical protein
MHSEAGVSRYQNRQRETLKSQMDDDPPGGYNAGTDMPRCYADASKEAKRVGSWRADP